MVDLLLREDQADLSVDVPVPELISCDDGSGQMYDPNPDRLVEIILVNNTGSQTLWPPAQLSAMQRFLQPAVYAMPGMMVNNPAAAAT